MASNYRQMGDAFTVPKTAVSPSTHSVGSPVIVGSMPAIAMSSSAKAGTSDTTIWTYGIYEKSVTAAAAITAGQILYITSAGVLTDTATSNTRWGYAIQAIGSAGTSTIRVKVGY